jgi:hypothetical protein
MKELEVYIGISSYLIAKLRNDSYDEERLMHVSSSGHWLSIVWKTRIVLEWWGTYLEKGIHVLIHKHYSHWQKFQSPVEIKLWGKKYTFQS